jgi:hypothetical protein
MEWAAASAREATPAAPTSGMGAGEHRVTPRSHGPGPRRTRAPQLASPQAPQPPHLPSGLVAPITPAPAMATLALVAARALQALG